VCLIQPSRHPSVAMSRLRTRLIRSANKVDTIKACFTNPVSLDAQDVIRTVFFDALNQRYLADGASMLRDIGLRAARVAQAGDKFSPDAQGLAQLSEYLGPMETALAAAVPETRSAILSPVWRRQTEIAAAVLQNASAQLDGATTLDQLRSLDSAARIVKAQANLLPGSDAILSRAEASIGKRLQSLIASDLAPIEDALTTFDGLAQLSARQSAAAEKFASFSDYPEYETAMGAARARLSTIRAVVGHDLAQKVAEAPDVGAIRAIRDSLTSLQQTARGSTVTATLMASYRSGLDKWFRAGARKVPPGSNDNANADVTGGSGPGQDEPDSAFTAAGLNHSAWISSLYRRNFLPVYRDRALVYYYVAIMLSEIGPRCPGRLAPDFLIAIMRRQLSPNMPDNLEGAGVDILMTLLMETAKLSRNPGEWMKEQISQGVLINQAQSDARSILATTQCDDPAMHTFLRNTQTFFEDPSFGVPATDLSMADICLDATPRGQGKIRANYCACAGPLLDQNLTPVEETYIRTDSRRRFWDVVQLDPDLHSRLSGCTQ
jgi:hypothetical protein